MTDKTEFHILYSMGLQASRVVLEYLFFIAGCR